jgi:hypothetical protein
MVSLLWLAHAVVALSRKELHLAAMDTVESLRCFDRTYWMNRLVVAAASRRTEGGRHDDRSDRA